MNNQSTITKKNKNLVLIDGSRLIIEAMVKAGAEVFIGYPITPANLLYFYSSQRFPIALAAADEITTLQWMAGFSAVGKLPVTATSFPGFALMVESINMAYMMELPMVIVLAQRLGPSTGTATSGAQGDLLLLNGTISGGYPLPTICISNLKDCWELAAKSVAMAVKLRTPVILLTSKEMVMTLSSFDTEDLPEIESIYFDYYQGQETYCSYLPQENLVPAFLPVGNDRYQVRLNASTHDTRGILQNNTKEALENTIRLQKKLEKNLSDFTFYELNEKSGADSIIVSYDITAQAAREAVSILKSQGKSVSLLIIKTIFPLPLQYGQILEKYSHVIIAEENHNGQLKQILYGNFHKRGVYSITAVGKMITPQEIIHEVNKHEA